jgi:hypothetical protein
MRPFLAVPLRERLVLLALYDNRSMEEIKGAYPWAKETDVRLTSHRIQAAVSILFTSLDEPTAWMDPGPYPGIEAADLTDPNTQLPINSRDIPDDIEKQLRQALFPSVTLMLFGAHVPPAVNTMSLQHRTLVYLIVVEELGWGEAMEMLECSKRQVHISLTEMVEALGG